MEVFQRKIENLCDGLLHAELLVFDGAPGFAVLFEDPAEIDRIGEPDGGFRPERDELKAWVEILAETDHPFADDRRHFRLFEHTEFLQIGQPREVVPESAVRDDDADLLVFAVVVVLENELVSLKDFKTVPHIELVEAGDEFAALVHVFLQQQTAVQIVHAKLVLFVSVREFDAVSVVEIELDPGCFVYDPGLLGHGNARADGTARIGADFRSDQRRRVPFRSDPACRDDGVFDGIRNAFSRRRDGSA